MNPWSKLPAMERGAYIRAGVRNGLRSLDAIERAYGEYASGGDLDATGKRRMTDEEYRKKIREIAAANARKWGMSAEDAYRYMMRHREYDYRSYYNDNTKDYSPTADREMPERYKTYWNPTFTRESKYSGVKNGKYNPQGAVGGHWENGEYIPADEYHARLQEELKKREASANRAYSYGPGGHLSGAVLTGNKTDEGGTKSMSDIEFGNLMYNLAGINAKYWGVTQEEAYREMLNDPTYDYRGFYEANPNAQNNTETHWPDTYKTYQHPTFSNESIYSGRIVFPFNPTGAVGGRWEGDEYIPNDEYHRRSWEEEKARMNQRAKGGRLAHKFEGTLEPTQWLDLFKRSFRNAKYTITNALNPDVWKAKREYNKLAEKVRREGERTYKEAEAIKENDRKKAEAKKEATRKYIENHAPKSLTRKWLADKQKNGELSDIEKKYIQASDKQSKEAYYINPDGQPFRLQDNALAMVYPSIIDSVGSHFANAGISETIAAGLPYRETTWANPAQWWKDGVQILNNGSHLINPFYLINYEDPYMRAVRYAKENHNGKKDPRSYEQMLIDGFNYANSQAQQEYGGEGEDHNILSQAARFYMNGTYNATPGYKDKVRTEGQMLLNTNPDFRVLMDANYGIFPNMEGTKKTINR